MPIMQFSAGNTPPPALALQFTWKIWTGIMKWWNMYCTCLSTLVEMSKFWFNFQTKISIWKLRKSRSGKSVFMLSCGLCGRKEMILYSRTSVLRKSEVLNFAKTRAALYADQRTTQHEGVLITGGFEEIFGGDFISLMFWSNLHSFISVV